MTVRYDDEPEWDDTEVEELPRRPRRRLLTPITGALAAVVLVALGFLAGVEVQKSEEGTGTASAPSGFPGAPGGDGSGAPGSGNGTLQGTVANLRGSTLYVIDDSGNTVRVKTNRRSEVVRAASSGPDAIHPGDTVIVQGKQNDDGSYTADQLTATADGVSLFGPFGAGGPPQGGPPGG